MSVMVK